MTADRDHELSPPPEELSPAMAAWWNETRTRHSDLRSAYSKVRDTLIENEIARARNSNEAPDDYVALKVANAHTPHVHPEYARRLSASGEVETKQTRKGARRFVSLSSYLRAARKYFG